MLFYYSYKEEGGHCHVPHDTAVERPTPLGLYGIEQTGYEAYFMQNETIPAFSEDHSGVGVIYWREEIDDRDYNVDLEGVATVAECFVACQLTTEEHCWIFRYYYRFWFVLC